MKDKEKILQIIEENYPEIAVMLIKELLEQEQEDPLKINKIKKILTVWEQGSIKPDYSAIYVYNDGPNDIKQLTLSYGFTEFGTLKKLVKNYADNPSGEYSDEFKKWSERIGEKPSIHSNTEFKNLLKKAGQDPIMQYEQDKLFEKVYIQPAIDWFKENGFTKPLSLLSIANEYLHSGSIMSFLRKRHSAYPPSKGGSEKEWIEAQNKVRHEWLRTHRRPILRNTVYRTQLILDLIEKGDWELNGKINTQGIIIE